MADSHEEGPLTYERYLKITELLKLQQGSKNAVAKGDELHFIIVHQIFELWFRLLRSELSWIRDAFDTEHVKEQAVADSVRGAEGHAGAMGCSGNFGTTGILEIPA